MSTKCCFSWKFIFPLLVLCMHLWLNLLTGLLIPKRKKTLWKYNVQSQRRVVRLWYYRFWESSFQRGRRTKLCIISFLKRIIQICNNNKKRWVSKSAFYLTQSTLLFGGNFPFRIFVLYAYMQREVLRAQKKSGKYLWILPSTLLLFRSNV